MEIARRVHHLSVRGADPVNLLTAPLPATDHALKRAGMTTGQIDLFEVNEAFASSSYAGEDSNHDRRDLGRTFAARTSHPKPQAGAV